MILSPEFYEQLRAQIRVSDIVRQRVVLSKKGQEYSGLCPFHNEKTPSFTVNDVKRFFYCFGCGAHGDVIKFLSDLSGLTYQQSAIKLAEDNGVEIPKLSKEDKKRYEEADHLQGILEQANKYFVSQLNDETRLYLTNRGIDAKVVEEFSIGYSPGWGAMINFFEKRSVSLLDLMKAGLVSKSESGKIYEFFNARITFPIRNIYNKIVGFGGRVTDDSLPKYINSPETLIFKKSEVVYGENVAASGAHKKNYTILVEGYMDVIALQKAGLKEAVACLGTAVNEKHLHKLWRFGDEIIVCLDGDEAGARASKRLIDIALPHISHDKRVSFAMLPKGLDPDDVINKEGVKAFQGIIENRSALSERIWLNEFGSKVFKTAEDRALLEMQLDEYAKKIKHQALAKNFKKFFSEQIWQNFSANNKRNNYKTGSKNEGSGSNLKPLSNLSEAAVLEMSILALVVNYPILLSDERACQDFLSVNITDPILVEFRDWYLEKFENSEHSAHEYIAEEVKRTRFSELYFVLCDSGAMFLDVSFIKKNIENLTQIFNLFRKKHFLLLLREEYSNVASSNSDSAEAKANFYIQEIQKITKEIFELNNSFIN